MSNDHPAAAATSTGYNRQHPRLVPRSALHIELAARGGRLKLRDISPGGFAVTGPRAFEPGAAVHFMFTSTPSLSFVVEAKAVHCREILATDHSHRYVAGFVFVNQTGDDDERIIQILIDLATNNASVH